MLAPLSTPDFLDLQYRSDLQVLLGRWTRAITLEESRQGYARILEAAQQVKTRFWLLDIRRRPRVDNDNVKWLVEDYYPQLPLLLNGTVYLAYLMAPELSKELAQSGLVPPDEAYIDLPFQMGKFITEQDALLWLGRHRQQEQR
jgi:hypothetical protein